MMDYRWHPGIVASQERVRSSLRQPAATRIQRVFRRRGGIVNRSEQG